MPFRIKTGDLTQVKADVIVNAANRTLLGGGGVDGAIHRTAGPELLEECRTLGGCEVGEARITGGYRLKAKHVIHTVGPVWQGGDKGERELLYNAYSNSLKLAEEHGLKSVAFPLISSGIYSYPKDKAMEVAVEAIDDFLEDSDSDMDVTLVLLNHRDDFMDESIREEISDYIAENLYNARRDSTILRSPVKRSPTEKSESSPDILYSRIPELRQESMRAPMDLSEYLDTMEDTFTERLLRLIDNKGLKDSDVYKKANIDRKLFSKIRKDKNYSPSKNTAVALGIALELDYDDLNDLLRTAGYSLSKSSRWDLIIEYFVMNRRYNIHDINQALYTFQEKLLGA